MHVNGTEKHVVTSADFSARTKGARGSATHVPYFTLGACGPWRRAERLFWLLSAVDASALAHEEARALAPRLGAGRCTPLRSITCFCHCSRGSVPVWERGTLAFKQPWQLSHLMHTCVLAFSAVPLNPFLEPSRLPSCSLRGGPP